MRRQLVVPAVAAVAVMSTTLLATPAPAVAAHRGAASGVLSARLTELAASPGLGRVATARTLSLAPDGPGSLVTDDGGRVLVQVLLRDTSAATVAALGAVGTVLNVSPAMSRATVLVPPNRLASLESVPAATYADLVPAPLTGSSDAATGTGADRATTASARRARTCSPLGNEADAQLKAAKARGTFGVDGSGVVVGVLSDSYDDDPSAATTAGDDVRSGDLPGPGNPCGRTQPVQVVEEHEGGSQPTDEGRAMLQAVHDLAPGAGLAFATATGGPDVLADNIVALQRAGADVIVDDFTYFTEPFFQPGVVDHAVSTVTDRGVTYVSSAGNSNTVLDGHDVGSWETPVARLGACPVVAVDAGYGALGSCVQFDAASTDPGYGMTVGSGGTITPVLQWAEPAYGVTDDFDVFLVDASTRQVLAESTSVQASSKTPVEWLSWTNSGGSGRQVELVVNRRSGTGTPRLKVAFVRMSRLLDLEHTVSTGSDIVGPTVFGHNGGPDTLSVAAVPYDDASSVQTYSARGPVTHYFGPVRGTKAAARLATPQRINAPQVAGTDGYRTTFFGSVSAGGYRFYGTSAAAPAVAAVAALVRDANPGLGPTRVRSVLQQTAMRVGGASSAAAGSGVVDADRAVALVRPPGAPLVTTTKVVKKVAGEVKVGFRRPTTLSTAPLSGYDARCRSTDGGDPRTASRAGTSTAKLVVTGLDGGRTYRCSVRARTAYGAGAYAVEGATVVARGTPGRPKHVRAEATKRHATLSFRPPKNAGGVALTGYVGTCVAGDRTRTAPTSQWSSEVTVRRLAPGKTYECRVQAVNRYGSGRRSHPVTVTTRA